MLEKFCSKCVTTLPMTAFNQHSGRPKGQLNSWCMDCRREYHRNWRKKFKESDPEEYKARQRKYNLSRYGLTPQKYEDMLHKQGGACAICGDFPDSQIGNKLYIDHCHETGEIRGLLCHQCNSGVGHFRDSLDILHKAAVYLSDFNDTKTCH